MTPKFCALCAKSGVILKRPKIDLQQCIFYVFETEVHDMTTKTQLFKPGDRVVIVASGEDTPIFLRRFVAYPSFRSQ